MEEEEEVILGGNEAAISMSKFDYSIDNHFKAMESISKLCGDADTEKETETDTDPLKEEDDAEIQRLYSSVTFLREWRQYRYEPRVVRFARETASRGEKGVDSVITLPQFSSATVPKSEEIYGGATSPDFSNDFVMYVGGSVWALDWCPRVHERPDCHIKCEFVAVATHPPESYHHKIGAPLVGRGVIQIWCILNVNGNEEEAPRPTKKQKQRAQSNEFMEDNSLESKRPRGRPRKSQIEGSIGNEAAKENSTQFKKPRGRPRKNQIEEAHDNEVTKENLTQLKKPRGRPRKKPINESIDGLDCNNQCIQALAVQYPEDSSELLSIGGVSGNSLEQDMQKNKGERQQSSTHTVSACNVARKATVRGRRLKSKARAEGHDDNVICPPLLTQNEGTALNHQIQGNCGQYPVGLNVSVDGDSLDVNASSCSIPNSTKAVSACNSVCKTIMQGRGVKSKAREGSNGDDVICPPLLTQNEGTSAINHQMNENSGQDPVGLSGASHGDALDINSAACSIPNSTKARSACKTTVQGRRLKSRERTGCNCDDNICPPLLTQNEGTSAMNPKICENSGQDTVGLNYPLNGDSLDINSVSCSISKDVALPRVVLCLAHNGKVAWDVKWRPWNASDPKCQHRMGYLAVLLGNGSLEVWDVPLPHTMKFLYSSSHKEGTDPRFVKLEPVFKCSKVKCGEIQSIPLTLEWSTSYPHDYLLSGCHDGTVALWKFSTNGTSRDTRPLLCFSADTVPIRAIAWAPVESDQESANIILTAGHAGLKFWDIRDPFRPLWDIHPVPKYIYSLDWLPDPRCIILSFDDGTMRLLSLVKAAYDGPVNGTPSVGPKQFGMHVFNCSSFAIWSVQVSRLTGMVAYCSADGAVCRFQLTTKAVEKDPSRNRAPHFMCGSLSEDNAAITVNTPLPEKPINNVGDNLRSMRGFLSESNHVKRTNDNKAKCPASDSQPLALCYGDDPGIESGSEETLAALKSKKKPKPKSSNKKMAGEDQALVCRDEEQDNVQKKESEKGEAGDEIEVIPPNIVSMHRVRWNMNKGSERWLCSGGAAGIVRCQEIVMSNVDKVLARKR